MDKMSVSMELDYAMDRVFKVNGYLIQANTAEQAIDKFNTYAETVNHIIRLGPVRRVKLAGRMPSSATAQRVLAKFRAKLHFTNRAIVPSEDEVEYFGDAL